MGESNVWKTKGGAVPSITDIYCRLTATYGKLTGPCDFYTPKFSPNDMLKHFRMWRRFCEDIQIESYNIFIRGFNKTAELVSFEEKKTEICSILNH